MKRICLLFIVVLMFAVSCSLFDSGDDSTISQDKSVVNVKLSVVQSSEGKGLETYSLSGVGEYCQYKATLQSGDSSAQGTKNQWTDFSNNTSVGYFAPGTWKFEVRMICGSKTEYGVICQGSTTVNLSENSKTVAIPLTNVYNSLENGKIEFDISVPSISTSNGSLKIYADDVLTVPDNCNVSRTGSVISFKGSLQTSAGYKRLKFEFWDRSVTTDSDISSQTLVVRVVENSKVGVRGSLSNSTYSDAEFTITYSTLSVFVTGPAATAPKTSTKYSCTATGGSSYNYQWYLNGVACEGATSSVYNLSVQYAGVYSLTCIVWTMDGSTKVYASSGMEVTVK